jgi:hypothetical protein
LNLEILKICYLISLLISGWKNVSHITYLCVLLWYMIVFFCYKKAFLKYACICLKYFKHDYVVLTAPDEYYFTKAGVIIPIGIGAQNKLSNYPQYKDKCLVCDSKVYKMLDDKLLFYNYIKKHDLLSDTGVKLIPSYKCFHAPNTYGTFIIKQKNGAGSSSNKIKKDYLHNLIKKYSDDNQIQDVIDIKNVYSINCLCNSGQVISGINFIIDGYIKHTFYNNNEKIHIQNVEKKFKKVIKRIVGAVGYSGLLEIEFIVATNGCVYLMECNPRVSSNMLCKEDDDTVPFNENLFYPYVACVLNKKIELVNYEDMAEVTYWGDEKIGSYCVDGNLIKFSFE